MNHEADLALWPSAASAGAVQTDHLVLSFTVLTLLLVVPIFIAISIFALRYREGTNVSRSFTDNRDRMLEMTWLFIPFLLTLIFFAWGAKAFIVDKTPPANATRVEAIGRQWMWKFQHPGGQSEINDLHVPTGEPILIHMISQDVIHALYIPAMRISMETLPGRYTELWFTADRVGRYHILCTEFCGTDHSVMGGYLTVMTPSDYADWLLQSGTPASLATEGKRLFSAYGCSGCHLGDSTVRAPSLAGLYDSAVPLEDGTTIKADASYIRDKILNPDHNKIAGYKQVMPAFKGVLSEGDLTQLVAFIQGGAGMVQMK